MQVTMDLALLTGLRRGDLIGLTRDNLTEEGILVRPSKTENSSGKSLLIEWSDDLREVVARAKSIKPQVRQPLICNLQGKAYTPHGFTGMWAKLMQRALEKTDLKEPFRFNDLRAKSASDDTLEAASERLGHTNLRTTQDFYRRKPSRVRPLKRSNYCADDR
jgi:integrase